MCACLCDTCTCTICPLVCVCVRFSVHICVCLFVLCNVHMNNPLGLPSGELSHLIKDLPSPLFVPQRQLLPPPHLPQAGLQVLLQPLLLLVVRRSFGHLASQPLFAPEQPTNQLLELGPQRDGHLCSLRRAPQCILGRQQALREWLVVAVPPGLQRGRRQVEVVALHQEGGPVVQAYM